MPRPTPEHGTEQRYNHGCREACCRAAHRAAMAHRRRMKAYGRHVPAIVSNVGARRRCEALMTLGWTYQVMSRRLGWHEKRLHALFYGNRAGITRRNHDAIVRLYDDLWATRAPQRDRHERTVARRAMLLAQRRGYPPPLAWNDDTIDDPDARPHVGTCGNRPLMVDGPPFATCDGGQIPSDIDEIAVERAMRGDDLPLTKAERSEAVARLTARGYSAAEIAERLRISGRTVVRKRSAAA